MIIVLGHLVTIPTVLAVSEIATNRRVAGGGAYYIISRSFGTSIGGSIGIALYLSQAISIAFYMVAFAEAFKPVYGWITATYEFNPDPRWLSVPCTALLIALMLTKGADLVLAGLTMDDLESDLAVQALQSYDGANEVLFVHSSERISVD